MILTDKEVARLRSLLREVDTETCGKSRKAYIQNRTRNIRLLLVKADRRERKANGGLFD